MMTRMLDEGRTIRARRIGQAVALLVAPWAFVIANATDAWTTRHGGSDETAKGALQLSAAHPMVDKWGTLAAMVGCILFIPAVLGAMSLVRVRAARLGLAGGVLMIAGYVCYFGLCFQGYATIAMGEHGGATADHIAVQNLMMNQAFFVGPALVFVVGNLIGTLLLGLALIRAHAVPTWAGLCVIAWPVLHIVGGSWGEVAGAAIEALGLALVGVRVLASSPEHTVPADSERVAVTAPTA